MPATLDGRLMALLAVLVALGACATGAPAERLVAQTAHPLPPSEKRPLVRCAIDGEYLVLTAVLELGCKQVEQRIYEPSEPTEHAHKRFESLVLPKIVPCGEAPMQRAEVALLLDGTEYALGQTDTRGKLRVPIPGIIPYNVAPPGPRLRVHVQGQDAGSVPTAPLQARQRSRHDLVEELTRLASEPQISQQTYAKGEGLVAQLRQRGLGGDDVDRLGNTLFQKQHLTAAEEALQQSKLEEAAQLAERAAMAGESFAPPPSVRKAMQSRRMTRVAAIDTIGEIDAAIKRDSSSLCNGAVSVAGALTSVAAGKDPRMMWIWPVLQATLGDAAQEYLTDACSRLLALWPS